MDGVARGARIIVQDVADPSRCTTNSLVERGGNVDPGRLLDRMNAAICPNPVPPNPLPTAGACANLRGGGMEGHLAVLPFGTPNYTGANNLSTNGSYPQEAVDLDTFLYNNRDFMIAVPVGNNGGRPGSNSARAAGAQTAAARPCQTGSTASPPPALGPGIWDSGRGTERQ